MKVGNKVCVMRGDTNIVIYATNMPPMTLPAGASDSQIENAVAEYELERQALAKKEGEFLAPLKKPEKPGIYYCVRSGPAKEIQLLVVGRSRGGPLYVVNLEDTDYWNQSINHPDYEGLMWFGPIDALQVKSDW